MEKCPVDLKKYKYGSSVIVQESTVHEFIKDIYAYEFQGWCLTPDGYTLIQAGEEILNVTSDVHLYAKWSKICVLDVNATGVLTMNPKYAHKVKHLDIPTIVQGTRVSAIAENFAVNATNLISVSLPRVELTINFCAFESASLQRLVLPSYDYLRDYPRTFTIKTGAIKAPNMDYLYIPYSVSNIESLGVIDVKQIHCEIESKPSGWAEDWTNCTMVDWSVVNNG
jgi:hypothetical protein